MSVASPEEVAAAMDIAPPPDDWAAMAEGLMPVFERRRPFPVDIGRPVRTMLPPGVSVTFAYDLGPALMRVTDEMASLWPVAAAQIVERAMANLRRRVEEATDERGGLGPVDERIDDIPIRALVSGNGWASTLILVPDLLERIFGRQPALFVAPMRDLLIGLPIDIETELATWISSEFEAFDPNCLCLEAFAWSEGRLTVRPLARTAAIA